MLVRALSLLLTVSVPAASAAELTFSYKNHLLFSHAQDPGDVAAPRTSLFMDESSLHGDYSNYKFSVDFSNQFTPDADSSLNRPFTLEKKTATATLGNWEIVGGDSHQELGRGIALSLYRDPVFGVDNTVEGAAVKYSPEGASAGVFFGRVNALKSPVAINPMEVTLLVDNEMWLTGAYANGEVSTDTRMGGHYFFAAKGPLEDRVFDQTFHTAGGSFQKDSIADEVDVYAESNLLFTSLTAPGAPSLPMGMGSYGSVSWSPFPWKAKLEIKDYRDYAFDFRRPPTLEEDIIESINISDVSATRMTVEHRQVETKTTLFSSYLFGEDRSAHSAVHHGVVGSRFVGPLGLENEVRGGYRSMPGKSNLAHVSFKVKKKTFKGQAVELGYRKLYEHRALDILPTVADRNLFDFTYTFSEKLNVTVGYEYLPRLSETLGNHFFNAGAALRTGPLTSRAFVGKTSGGTLCSGGVCRQVPPYTGAYLETHLSL